MIRNKTSISYKSNHRGNRKDKALTFFPAVSLEKAGKHKSLNAVAGALDFIFLHNTTHNLDF